MSQTKQGAFPETYPHIEAPTVANEAAPKIKRRRLLRVPQDIESDREIYRTPTLYYLSKLPWLVRRKIDGENIRIKWDGTQALWNGKTNAFNCSANFTDFMNSTFLEEIFEEKFERDKTVILFGEHVGPKVQTNDLKLDEDDLVLFDVFINGFWLEQENVKQISRYFGVKHHSDFEEGPEQATLSSIIQDVAAGRYLSWEGIVATPAVEIRDRRGVRQIVKIKNKDYYCPHAEED